MASVAKAPMHLWIVGVLSLLWNCVGIFDYLMTQTANEAYLANFTEAQRTYFQSFSPLMEAAWACGVWGAFVGSLLLLARSRYAVWAFGISLGGLLVSTVYQYGLSSPPADMFSTALVGMSVVIWVIAIALFYYALKMRKAGVLR